MAGLVPAIHVLLFVQQKDVDARDMGEPTGPARVAGPTTSSATAFCERLCAGMTVDGFSYQTCN